MFKAHFNKSMRKFLTVYPFPRMFSVSSINIDDWMNFHVFGRLFRQLAETKQACHLSF